MADAIEAVMIDGFAYVPLAAWERHRDRLEKRIEELEQQIRKVARYWHPSSQKEYLDMTLVFNELLDLVKESE